jgi:hypothetical protein
MINLWYETNLIWKENKMLVAMILIGLFGYMVKECLKGESSSANSANAKNSMLSANIKKKSESNKIEWIEPCKAGLELDNI